MFDDKQWTLYTWVIMICAVLSMGSCTVKRIYQDWNNIKQEGK